VREIVTRVTELVGRQALCTTSMSLLLLTFVGRPVMRLIDGLNIDNALCKRELCEVVSAFGLVSGLVHNSARFSSQIVS
jgi:hypothetical protein